ncbi:carboxy terminal-processing peptidase [Dokdonia sp. Hel_I_53]|uniref:carboxy terminal-processing peptidase n=1 Tax=Dokdonia sp. Hel_I_53 TaxID=1566287 RepID=UPI0011AABEF1|nr:carboxy terminal-processing peptidase [Dokdonia sp. Hel_I_53]
MKRNLKLIALALLFSVASCSFTTKSFEDTDKDKILLDLISYVLSRGHYNAKEINDEFSQAVFDDYIDALDPYRRFFYKRDIDEFQKYKYEIDDAIRDKDLSFFNLTYERLKQRTHEAQAIQQEILTAPFDFNQDEDLNTEYEKSPFAKNKRELRDRWRKQLKLNALSAYFDKKNDEEASLDEKDSKIESLKETFSDKELELKSRQEVTDNTKEFFEFTNELERKDYFSIFLNAIVEGFDPHTYYFAPVEKDRFDTQMSGQFQGIGARLQKKNGEIRVTDIISGGPAWRSEQLKEGDVILKVKQEDEKDALNVVGMRLEDAIEFIKGPKGTKVTLSVKTKLDGSTKNITIERDIVELEEVYARSAKVVKDGRKYGLINLPKFYFDMQNYKEKNAAKDVKREVERLKREGVEGLVIDLRNNGGGSLKTVVDIAGLFIRQGPVVQVAGNGDEPEVLEDLDPSIVWDGPLVILVNEISASASEILAAAMQDYERAIIIGGKQTYGKGTVQNVVDLNPWLRNNQYGDLGALKVTTQKFYRVNGGSTQLEGVKSDVVVADRFKYVDIGERDQKNPLPWDKIAPADYKKWDGNINLKQTIKKSNARMSKNEHLKLIDEYAKWIKERRDDNIWSLQYEKYKERIETSEAFAKKFDAIDEYDSNLEYNSLPYEQRLFKTDTILKEKRNRWHKSLAKDVYVEEALNVLKDLKSSNIRNKLATLRD